MRVENPQFEPQGHFALVTSSLRLDAAQTNWSQSRRWERALVDPALNSCYLNVFRPLFVREQMIEEIETPSHISLEDGVEAAILLLRSWAGRNGLVDTMNAFSTTPVHLAGGAVRDALRGKMGIKDFDIFVTGPTFDAFVASLEVHGAIRYGPFGSPRWFPGEGSPYADVISVDRFENGVERCFEIDDALRQFDFTANAVAIDLRNLALHDPLSGIADARAKVLRCIRFDYPNEPIAPGESLTRQEVLWIRLNHYANILGFEPDPVTRDWITSHSNYAAAVPLFASRFFTPVIELAR